MTSSVCNLKLIIGLVKNEIQLQSLSNSEIASVPIDILKDHIKSKVRATELLSLWHRLPSECRSDYEIKILLPCFLHYNAPHKETHFDGPPSSQKKCPFCKTSIY